MTTPHDAHVEAGRCPKTIDKTWCNARAEHLGPHWAIRVPTPGQPVGPNNPTKIEWGP